MNKLLRALLGCAYLGAALGQGADFAPCPSYQQTDETKACAWIPSCGYYTECESKCVANIVGDNTLLLRIIEKLTSATTCIAVSAIVQLIEAEFQNSGGTRRLMAGQHDVLRSWMLPLLQSSGSKHSRRILDLAGSLQLDAINSCATDAAVDTAEPAFSYLLDVIDSELANVNSSEPLVSEALETMYNAWVPYFKDAGKMKQFVKTECKTETISGDELSLYWDVLGLDESAKPTSMPICKSVVDNLAQYPMQLEAWVESSSGVCAPHTDDITYVNCVGALDAALMRQDCMDSVTPLLDLKAADVVASVTAWNEIHNACVAITDAAGCQAHVMEDTLSTARDAMSSMDADATVAATLPTTSTGKAAAVGSIAAMLVTLIALVA